MRICRGVYVGLALFGLLAHVLLGLDGSVLPVWLPACVGVGVAASLLQRRGAVQPEPNARTWVLACTITVISVVGLAMVIDVKPKRRGDGRQGGVEFGGGGSNEGEFHEA